jgi:hypothetical protein
VRFDGLAGHEERLGDLAIGHALRRHPSDACLACGERVPAAEGVPARPRASHDELLAGAPRKRGRATAVRKIEALPEPLACLHTIACVSQQDSQVDERTGVLQRHPAVDAKPEFSPDGTKLAFMSARDGNLDIYVLNAEPETAFNEPDNLTNTSAPIQSRYPSWSPDGTKIAFWPGTGNGLQPDAEIFVMNADGSGQRNLTDNLVGDIQPSWGPARVKKANGQAN